MICYTQNINLEPSFQKKVFEHASVALTIINAESGEVLFDHNGDLALIPASTLKAVTTFSGLEILGEDFTFNTNVYYSGDVLEDGSLYGNIIIKGSGDPTLASPFFSKSENLEKIKQKILRSIRKIGIKCIEGTVIIDNSFYNDSPINPTWQWNDLSNYYAAGAWAFNIHENLFRIYFNRTYKEFHPTSISHLDPMIPNVIIDSKVKTGKFESGDNAYIYSHPYHHELTIKGTIPPGQGLFKIKGAIPRPDLFFKNNFIGFLNDKRLITSTFPFFLKEKTNRIKKILTLKSPSLSEIVKETNFKSNNLYAEAILKSLAIRIKGKANTQNGISAIRVLLAKLDLKTSSFNHIDGSGLSSRNRISTAFLATFLYKLYNQHDVDYFKRHLPKAGEEGTVRSLFNNHNSDFDMYLKSGSMSQVQGYCGIITSSKDKLIFSFISNGHVHGNQSIRIAFVDLLQKFMQ